MVGRASPPKRVLRRLPPSPRRPGRFAALRATIRAGVARVLRGPRRACAAVAARLAPYNPRAHRRFREAAAHMLALGHGLQAEFSETHSISFSLVYRLEAAQTTMKQALDAICLPSLAPRPDNRRTRMATALLEVAHLAQLAREWQQDVINLQHTLMAATQMASSHIDPYEPDGIAPEQPLSIDERLAVESGVKHLQGYISQNMHDLGRWLQAAEQLQ